MNSYPLAISNVDRHTNFVVEQNLNSLHGSSAGKWTKQLHKLLTRRSGQTLIVVQISVKWSYFLLLVSSILIHSFAYSYMYMCAHIHIMHNSNHLSHHVSASHDGISYEWKKKGKNKVDQRPVCLMEGSSSIIAETLKHSNSRAVLLSKFHVTR